MEDIHNSVNVSEDLNRENAESTENTEIVSNNPELIEESQALDSSESVSQSTEAFIQEPKDSVALSSEVDVLSDLKNRIQSIFDEKEEKIRNHYDEQIETLQLQKEKEIEYLKNNENLITQELKGIDVAQLESNTFHQPLLDILSQKVANINNFISNNLKHSLFFSYNSISADFVSESSLSINKDFVLTDNRLHWRGRSLQVSEKEILVTGGSTKPTQVLLINIETHEFKELPELSQGRELHAMV